MADVAVLYVDPKGPYPKLGVECWDATRDARLYDGPLPVVAHPPCGRWCQLAHVVEKRYGYRVGDDGGTFAAALASVRRWGGVLEHPAFSIAWTRYSLTRPPLRGWQQTLGGEWVCEVSQSAYGHRARKRTWLLYVGKSTPEPARFQRPRGEKVISGMKNKSARPIVERVWKEEARRTPVAFAQYLIALAGAANG